MNRASGVLLHLTSLPGPHGIGDLGSAAHAFLDFLSAARVGWWQMLPVVPPGGGDSPYKSTSAFAGNPLLLSLDRLVEEGLLDREDAEMRGLPEARVDFAKTARFKESLLRKASQRFRPDAPFEAFVERERHWLADYARFAALRERHRGAPWTEWRDEAEPSRHHEFLQYQFDRQWRALRAHAARRGVRLLGDLPIFVAHDSADVWARRELFHLDRRGRPTVVAGVPPDYFSETGQLWGNPLYDWKEMERQGHRWWIDRLRRSFDLFDAVRLDHFIGFHNYWEIPAGASDARTGRWMPGPGEPFFRAVLDALGPREIVAEDLGVLTPGVEALRDAFGFPGLRVLQFAFGPDRSTRPYRWPRNSVACTGTHDNETVAGWLAGGGVDAARALRYAGGRPEPPHVAMARLVWMSASDLAIAPAQDLLGLGNEARMNVPGTPDGNWGWRVAEGALDDSVAARVREMNDAYDRLSPG